MREFSFVVLLFLLFLLFSCNVEDEGGVNSSKKTEKVDNGSIRILFAGDLLLDRGVRKEIERKGVDYLFEGVDSIADQHDFFIVNLETPVTAINSPLNKKFIFRSDPKHLPKLKNHGVTHAILSNNHSMDQSKEGLLDTWRNLKANEITPIGGGPNLKEACSPTIINKNGKSLAIFGSAQIPIENWFPTDEKPTICQLAGEELVEEISNYKKNNPDHYIIVTLHWGLEYLTVPNLSQIDHAKDLIDRGADLIIGHHPHVIQSILEYQDKKIYFSIGNFIFDSSQPIAKKALLVSINIDDDGQVEVQDIPIRINGCRPEIE